MRSDGPLADVSVVSADSEAMLSEHELVDYREYKREVLTWLATLGKEPRKAEGYAPSTVSQASYQIDAVYRWCWTEHDGYTTSLSTDDADAYMRTVATGDTTAAHKAMVQDLRETATDLRDALDQLEALR